MSDICTGFDHDLVDWMFTTALALVDACKSGKDVTEYAHRLVKSVAPDEPEALRLPRRLSGDVYLNRGFVFGLDSFKLEDEPVSVVCYNDTVGAIQPKLKSSNVTVVYDWIFGDNESHGKAYLEKQDIWLDIDIERVSIAQLAAA